MERCWGAGQYREGEIQAIFEIENTTVMTEALRRASCLPYQVEKYMVLPEERANQLARKIQSPMFGQWFETDKWQVVYYDTLRDNRRTLKRRKKEIGELAGAVARRDRSRESESKQLDLL